MDEKERNNFMIYKYTIHYARVHNYNDGTYKWRPVIPVRQVHNSWVVIPLFTEKPKFVKLSSYLLIEELSKDVKIYIDLSRQDKLLISKENFNKYPIQYKNQKWHKLKKSTITLIQKEQNAFIYGQLSLLK